MVGWFLQARERITSTVKGIIEGRRKENWLQNGDFLDVILSKENLTDEERVSLILDLLLGGHETTATLMALLIYFLAHSPQALQQLRVLVFLSQSSLHSSHICTCSKGSCGSDNYPGGTPSHKEKQKRRRALELGRLQADELHPQCTSNSLQ